MNAVDDVRDLLGGLDPARDGRPGDEESRARELTRILATDRTVGNGRRRIPRRRLLLMAGAAVLAVAAGGRDRGGAGTTVGLGGHAGDPHVRPAGE
ncbi:hypothetical protein GCM10027614_03840 [Micromonospora vulcania]